MRLSSVVRSERRKLLKCRLQRHEERVCDYVKTFTSVIVDRLSTATAAVLQPPQHAPIATERAGLKAALHQRKAWRIYLFSEFGTYLSSMPLFTISAQSTKETGSGSTTSYCLSYSQAERNGRDMLQNNLYISLYPYLMRYQALPKQRM